MSKRKLKIWSATSAAYSPMQRAEGGWKFGFLALFGLIAPGYLLAFSSFTSGLLPFTRLLHMFNDITLTHVMRSP